MDCIILEFYYKSPAYTLMTRQVPTWWKEDECVRMNHVLGANAILINVLIIYQIMALKRHFLFGHIEKINRQGGSKNEIFG